MGLLFGLCLAEVGLRLMGYQGMQERTNTVFHDDLGQVPADSWINDAVFDPRLSSHVIVNQQQIPFAKRDGRTRVVFIGDSGTKGVGVAHDETFPLVFQALEESRGLRDLEVVNAGIVGLTTVGEYRLLADRIVNLQPDIVVLGLFMANDISWNLGNRHLLGEEPSAWQTFSVRLREHSAAAHFAYFQLLALNTKCRLLGEPDLTATEAALPISLVDDSGIHMLDYLGGEVATYQNPYSLLMESAFELLRELFQRFLALAEREDFQFVVAVIPTASQIADELEILPFEDPLGELRRRGVVLSENDFDYQKPLKIVRDICAELGIVCVDPTVAMRRVGARNAILPGDDHLSEDGHRILAESLARHFDDHNLRFANCPECPHD